MRAILRENVLYLSEDFYQTSMPTPQHPEQDDNISHEERLTPGDIFRSADPDKQASLKADPQIKKAKEEATVAAYQIIGEQTTGRIYEEQDAMRRKVIKEIEERLEDARQELLGMKPMGTAIHPEKTPDVRSDTPAQQTFADLFQEMGHNLYEAIPNVPSLTQMTKAFFKNKVAQSMLVGLTLFGGITKGAPYLGQKMHSARIYSMQNLSQQPTFHAALAKQAEENNFTFEAERNQPEKFFQEIRLWQDETGHLHVFPAKESGSLRIREYSDREAYNKLSDAQTGEYILDLTSQQLGNIHISVLDEHGQQHTWGVFAHKTRM